MRRAVSFIATAVVAVGFTFTASLPAGASGTGTIRGRITDRATGLPLEGACAFTIADGTFMRSAPTGSDGKYEIDAVPAGAWEAFAADCADHAVSYVPQVYKNIDGFRETDKQLVPVAAGAVTKRIDYSLRHGGDISVTTEDRHGNPIPNIQVCALFPDTNQNETFCEITDATGTTLLRGVLAGKAKLIAYGTADWRLQFYRNKTDFASATPIPVTLAHTTSVTVVMRPVTTPTAAR